MPGLKATTVSLQKKTATPVSGIAVKPRAIKITKKIEKTFRSMPTEGWIHIIPSDGKWKVRKYGAVRASGVYDKLETAIAAAKKISHSLSNPYIFVQDKNAAIVQTIHE